MTEQLNKLKTLLGEIYDLNAAQAVLGWDQQTYMPSGGAEERGNALATLARIAHLKMTSEEFQRALEDCQKQNLMECPPIQMKPDLLTVTRREVNRKLRIPAEWVGTFAEATAIGQEVWEQAKINSDFALFQPHLEKIIELRREYASFFQPYEHIYDPLLDEFEPGLKTADVQQVFAVLREKQVALIRELTTRPQVDSSFLYKFYPEDLQWSFGVDVISDFGFDWDSGRQDKSAHPFTTTFGMGDVRITTRLLPDHLGSALFSTMHEAGHAMYEQGFSPTLKRTPLATGASMAIHESQSRMWENLVGTVKTLLAVLLPKTASSFPGSIGKYLLDTFYRGINRVEPSLIRTESDEATYNLHIMLRLELEIALLDRKLEVKDLPEIWRARMKEYLGVVPPDDAHGVLQDVHWSAGLVGYFPTYALGNVISVQLWEKISRRYYPIWMKHISRGEFAPLLGWLHDNIHVHGAKFETQELVKRVTGSPIDPQPYLKLS